MSDEQDSSSRRGFASMPREKVQEIASKGGKARAEKARQNREEREQGGSGSSDTGAGNLNEDFIEGDELDLEPGDEDLQ